MRFSTSLKKNHEFRRLYAKGRSAASNLAVVYCRNNRSKSNRLGITVSSKLGNAVVRNRIRRRFKEAYRLNEEKLTPGHDIVIVARARSRSAGFAGLQDDLMRLFKKLDIASGK